MQKIALFIIAGLLASSVMSAAIADCLLDDGASSGNKCLICAAGKSTVLAATTCAALAPTGCVFHGAAFTAINNLAAWCDVCEMSKFSAIDGKCYATVNATTFTACGLKVAIDATKFECIGCDSVATYLDIDPLKGCAASYTTPVGGSLQTATSTPTLATITSCQPNSMQAATGSCVAYSTPVTTGEQHFKPATGTASKVYWVAAAASAINHVSGALTTTAGAGAGCWFTDGVSCVKCRPDMVPKYDLAGSAAPKTLKVTCSAWTAPTGTDKKCKASWMNGTAEQCIKCADINGTLSDANANFTCAAATNTTTNNTTTTTTNSSILGFSVAAFLLLIINRLF